MFNPRASCVVIATVLAPSLAFAQGQSESLETEASKLFKAARFKEAALKYEDSAAAAASAGRRAAMELKAANAHFNDRSVKAAKEALRRAFTSDGTLEIVPEFYASDFVKMAEDVKRSSKPVVAPSLPDLDELRRTSQEKLKDGAVEEVIYDLSNVPKDKLGPELRGLLVQALERAGRLEDARKVRDGEALAATTAPPVATPVPHSPSGTASTQPVATPYDLLLSGRDALARGDVATAQTAGHRVLELEPTSSEAYRLLGDVFRLRGDAGLAEANWKQALKLDERNEGALLALGEAAMAAKSWETAIDYLKKASGLNPVHLDKLLALGRAARRDKDLPRARQVFATATAGTQDPALLTEYGALLLESGDARAAIEPLGKAVTADPTRAVAHGNLAAAYRRASDNVNAEKAYREALKIEPNYLPALTGLGSLLLGSGSAREATDLYRRATSVDSRNVEAQVGLGRALRISGNLEGATSALTTAASDLDEPEVWNEAGVAEYARGRFAEAAAAFSKAVEKRPGFEEAKTNLGRAEKAAAFLKRAGG